MTRPVSIPHRSMPAAAARRRALRALVLCASWLACGCEDTQPTQLVVLIDSDFDVPSELSEVRALVRGPGERTASHRFPLAGADALPLSFGIEPLGGDASRAITVVVEGRDAADETLATRRAETGFVAGKRLLLPMHLARSCRRPMCMNEETCTERGCQPARVLPGELAAIVAGSELALPAPQFAGSASDAGAGGGDGGPASAMADAEPPDGGSEPATDAAPRDAEAQDAEPPDAVTRADGGAEIARITCEAPCACQTGQSCELTCGAACSTLCDASRCDVVAVGQFQLDATCSGGADCAIDARGSMNGRISCLDDSRCEVDCANSTGCRLACAGAGARCLLDCQGASGCRISDCPQTPSDCGGGVHACGLDCP